MNITMAGIDLAKRQLSVHGADQIGQVLLHSLLDHPGIMLLGPLAVERIVSRRVRLLECLRLRVKHIGGCSLGKSEPALLKMH